MVNEVIDKKRAPDFPEFIVLLAMMISLVAMSIDTMLPALSQIGSDLAVQRDNNTQLIISLFIFGIAAGQMVYGPLSDRTGRRPALFAGSFSILLAVPLGIIIGQAHNGTILPLVGGFALLGTISAIVIRKSEPRQPGADTECGTEKGNRALPK